MGPWLNLWKANYNFTCSVSQGSALLLTIAQILSANAMSSTTYATNFTSTLLPHKLPL